MLDFPKSSINGALSNILKRLHYPLEVMLTCVRWYAAYPLSLRHIEEMMQEREVFVDHATVHRWASKMYPGSPTIARYLTRSPEAKGVRNYKHTRFVIASEARRSCAREGATLARCKSASG